MTIDDVIASIERVLDPEVASPMAWFYDPMDQFEATDDSTLTITLTEPSALFQFVAMTAALHVVPKSAIEEFGIDFLRNRSAPDRSSREMVGRIGNRPREVRDYWIEGKPALDQFIYKIVPEGITRVTAIKNDEIQSFTAVRQTRSKRSWFRECELA